MTEGFWNGLSSGFAPAYETSFKAALDAPLKQAQIDFYKQRGKIAGRAADYKYGPDGKPLQDAEGNLVPVDAPGPVAPPIPNQPPVQPPPPAMAALPTLGPPKLGQTAMPDNLIPAEQAKGTEQANGLGGPPIAPVAPVKAAPAFPTIQPNVPPAVRDQMIRDAAKQKALDDRAAAAQAAALAKQEQGQQFKKANPVVGAAGGVTRGMASILRGVLNPQEQTRVDTLPGALALHNAAVDMYDAFQKANGDAGLATKLLQQWSAGKTYLSPIAQQLQGNPSKFAELYKSVTRQGGSEQAKLTNGSNAMPPEEQIQHNQLLYPGLAESRETAIGKLNILNDTVLRPAMQGPIGRLELYRDAKGKYPVQLYQDVHDNLQNQLSGFGSRIHSLAGVSAAPNGDMNNPLLGGGPKPGDIEQGHRFLGGDPAKQSSWEAVQ